MHKIEMTEIENRNGKGAPWFFMFVCLMENCANVLLASDSSVSVGMGKEKERTSGLTLDKRSTC